MATSTKDTDIGERMYQVLEQYWGYTSFRPMQKEVIDSILQGKESLTVLSTGGGKSLCFQLPALLMEGMAVVISPLISLMKDQVDSLTDIGIAAAYLNSSLAPAEQHAVMGKIRTGKIKLLYISPERLQAGSTLDLLRSTALSFFVIDEGHCISQWGHDFREDYRNLKVIKDNFASVSVHAFTATATREVQQDIVKQLDLNAPAVHIGPVDRPNLTYRVMPRTAIIPQITEILEKHSSEPGIIYCLRRDDVDTISAKLNSLKFKNVPYHAGLSDAVRHAHQDRFMREEIDIIVATIAFGMGIDHSNIRFIIHSAMPKNIEYYHQETGRAGRDGLPSSCYLFYGGGDFRTWSFFNEQSPNRDVMMDKLKILYNFCTRPQCRHKVLSNYFGQQYEKTSCDACDFCLDEVDMVDDPLTVSQKILSCVARVNQGRNYGFGAGHIVQVLKGNMNDKITNWRHQELSTFGIMKEESIEFIRSMVEQLIGQNFLMRSGEYSSLKITEPGREVLGGNAIPRLARPLFAVKKKEILRKRSAKKEKEWADIDKDLFQLLRGKRAELARTKGVPAYVIFGDKSLKDMAVQKPKTSQDFAAIFGVGDTKLKAYAQSFIDVIQGYLKEG